MLRKLLTLFVLLSGLAAAGAPAQARVVSLDEIRLEASTSLASPCATASHQGIAQFGQGHQPLRRVPNPCARTTILTHVPPVMLGVDRAHE